MEIMIGNAIVCLLQGDITEQTTDAIVNAANSTLMGGGGVDGAIHRKGGPKILEECRKIRTTEWPDGLATGKAVITTGGNLKAGYVIHAVGPIWRGGSNREDEFLTDAYQNSLQLSIEKKIRTISFPSISTGAYGFPIERAGRVAINAVKEFLEKKDKLDKVVFVLFTKSDFDIYEQTMREMLKNWLSITSLDLG